MNHKLTALLVSILLVLFCSGCRDRNEVDQMAIVIGTGIDRVSGAEPILLTVQVVNTAMAKGPGEEGGGGGGLGQPVITRTSQGKSLEEAIRNLEKTSSRKLFFSHNQLIVLGKTFAESDIAEVMDYINRNRELRYTNKVIVTEETAKQLLEAKIEGEKIPVMGLVTMLTTSRQTFVYPINLNDFLLYLKNDLGVSYAPVVNLKDVNREESGKLESSAAKKPAAVHLAGMAVFKNNRLVGVLDENDSRGLLWLINNLKGDTVTVSQGDEQFVVDIMDGNTRIIPHITDNGITMEIKGTAIAELRESGYLSPEIRDLEIYRRIEQETARILDARLEHTIDHAQTDLNADFPGFGNQIHNLFPADWHQIRGDWDQRFPDIPYTVSIQVRIVKSGITKGSVFSKDNEE